MTHVETNNNNNNNNENFINQPSFRSLNFTRVGKIMYKVLFYLILVFFFKYCCVNYGISLFFIVNTVCLINYVKNYLLYQSDRATHYPSSL